MRISPDQPTSNEKEPVSWSTVIWMLVISLIGFGFAIVRLIQFTQLEHPLRGLRLTRIELYIYRATGQWGIILIFVIMGIYGLYNAIKAYSAIRSSKH